MQLTDRGQRYKEDLLSVANTVESITTIDTPVDEVRELVSQQYAEALERYWLGDFDDPTFIGANELNDLEDVSINNPASDHLLFYDEVVGGWINGPLDQSLIKTSQITNDAGFLTSATESYISNVQLIGNNLVFTGQNNAYNSSVALDDLQAQTLYDVSQTSLVAADSLYQMTIGVPVEFRRSNGTTLLYLDETNSRVGIGISSPSATLDVGGSLKFVTGNEALNKVLTSDASGNADWTTLDHTYISDWDEAVEDTVAAVLVAGSNVTITHNDIANTITVASSYVDTNDIDYVSGVSLVGSDLTFTGVGNAFAGTVDLSSLLDDTDNYVDGASFNTANGELTLTRTGALADIVVDLDGRYLQTWSWTVAGDTGTEAIGNTDTVTFAGGTNVVTAYDALTNVLTINATDTNDIDYISGVTLTGTDLSFTGVGNAFTGTIDLSSFLDDTNTYVTSASFNTGNGILTLTRNDAATVTVDLDGRYTTTGHTHTASDITDFSEAVDDRVNGLLVAGANITLTYDDVANSLTIAATDTNDNYYLSGLSFDTGTGILTATVTGATNQTVDLDGRYAMSSHTHAHTDITDWTEAVQDTVGAFVVGGTNVTVTYDDVANTLTIASTDTNTDNYADSLTWNAGTNVLTVGRTGALGDLTATITGFAEDGHTHTSTDITNFNEAVDDRVAALLVAGTNVTLTYNDVANTLTIDATDTDTNYYLTALSFDTATGILTGTVSGASNPTVDLDGRYALTSHTHTTGDITGLEEYIEDTIAGALVAGTDIGITYDDVANTITVNYTGTAGSTTYLGLSDTPSAFTGNGNYLVRVNSTATALEHVATGSILLSSFQNDLGYDEYNGWNLQTDGTGTLTIGSGATVNFVSGTDITLSQTGSHITINYTGTDANDYVDGVSWTSATRSLILTRTGALPNLGVTLSGLADASHTHTTGDITGLQEYVEDAVATLLVAGKGIGLAYDDGAGILTISYTGSAGSTTYLGLSDTPANFTGQSSYLVRVNGGATALEHVATSSIALSSFNDDLTYDNYGNWMLSADSGIGTFVSSGASVAMVGGTGISTVGGSGTVTFNVVPGAIDHDALLNFVAKEHINHTSVSIEGGMSVSGGGDITTTRTLTLVNDETAPGNSQYYGTNGTGTKGWYSLPTSTTYTAGTAIDITGGAISVDKLGFEDLATPGSDFIAFYDSSQSSFQWLAVGTGLAITGTTLYSTTGGGSDYYATMSDGTNSSSASGSDTFKFRTANSTLDLTVTNNDATHGDNLLMTWGHLGIEDLTDPNADRIMFWDDSAGAVGWITLGSGLTLTGTTLSASTGSGSDYYANITDGTTTAAASGADTFKLRSSDGSISLSVTNNDVTHGDNVDITLAQAMTLENTLSNGNTSGANDIIMGNTRKVRWDTSASGSGVEMYVNGVNSFQVDMPNTSEVNWTSLYYFNVYESIAMTLYSGPSVSSDYIQISADASATGKGRIFYNDQSASRSLSLLFVAGTTSYELTLPNTKTGTLGYYDQIGGKAVNSLITAPTITQDGYAITWDNTSGEYTLTAVSGSSGANTALSNLTATAINQALIPDTTDAYNLGSSTYYWDSLYASNIHANGALTLNTLNNQNVSVIPHGTGILDVQSNLKVQGQMFGVVNSVTPANGSNGTPISIDWDNGNTQVIDFSSQTSNYTNWTINFSNVKAGATYFLIIKQGTNVQQIGTWPTSLEWPDNSAIQLTQTINKTDVYSFAAETTGLVYAAVVQNYSQ